MRIRTIQHINPDIRMENEQRKDALQESMERIQALSSLLGGEKSDMDLQSMMDAVRKAKLLMNMFNPQNEEEPNQITASSQQKNDGAQQIPPYVFPQSRQMSILQTALPYLDKPYQKNVFMILKLLEMRQLSQTDTISMQASERNTTAKEERQSQMLRAIRPFLREAEQAQVDGMLRVMRFSKAFRILNQEEL